MRSLIALTVLTAGLLAVSCSWSEPQTAADAVFVNAIVRTLDPDAPLAEAVAIQGGWIVGVGDADAMAPFIGDHTEVVSLEGAAVYPGFTDSHMHLSGVGAQLLELDLRGTQSLTGLLQRVRQEVTEKEPGEWILGRGWIESKWTPAKFPTRQDLDSVAPDHPVWLQRVDGHAAVANSLALKIAKIDGDTVSPPGGEIVLDAEDRPTGMIVDAAMNLVERFVPRRSRAYLRECLVRGAAEYASRGWTQVQIAGTDASEKRLLQELVATGKFPLRVVHATYGPGLEATAAIEAGPIGTEPGSMFTSRSIKVSYDGALGSGGAAMLEPYSDPDINGDGLLNEHFDAAFLQMAGLALHGEFQVEVHAIGDRANRHVLNLYEQVLQPLSISERRKLDPRFRIEHAQILDPSDLPRFKELGIIASIQPSHAITDLHFAPQRIGLERLQLAYAWKPLMDSGAHVCGGSDAPVEIGDPRIELYAAVERRDLDGFQGEGWHPEHAISFDRALALFTTHAAYATHQESWRGRIQPGYVADLTIFDRAFESTPPSEWTRRQVVRTVVGGRTVYDRDAAKAEALREESTR